MAEIEPIRVGPGFRDEFPGARPSAAEAAANLVRAAGAVLDEIDRRRRAVADLSASGFEVLAVLDGADRPLASHEIAEHLLVTTASMTSLLDTLTRKGLVTRAPHPSDRRKVVVEITDEARRIVDEVLPIVHATATEVFAPLDEAALQNLIDMLTTVRTQVAAASRREPQRPPPRVHSAT